MATTADGDAMSLYGDVGSPEAATANTARASSLQQQIVSWLNSKVGLRYIRSAQGPTAYDCSGLVTALYRQFGMELFPGSIAQSKYGQSVPIDFNQMQPGDLIFKNGDGGKDFGHVQVYIGNGEYIGADNSRVGVRRGRVDLGSLQAVRRVLDYGSGRVLQGGERTPLRAVNGRYPDASTVQSPSAVAAAASVANASPTEIDRQVSAIEAKVGTRIQGDRNWWIEGIGNGTQSLGDLERRLIANRVAQFEAKWGTKIQGDSNWWTEQIAGGTQSPAELEKRLIVNQLTNIENAYGVKAQGEDPYNQWAENIQSGAWKIGDFETNIAANAGVSSKNATANLGTAPGEAAAGAGAAPAAGAGASVADRIEQIETKYGTKLRGDRQWWIDNVQSGAHTLEELESNIITNKLNEIENAYGVKAQGEDAYAQWSQHVMEGAPGWSLTDFEANIAANAGQPVKGIAPAAGAAPAAPTPAAGDQGGLTDLLKRLGVDYPNAPAATPALLAFLRGVGLNLSSAEDVRNKAVSRLQTRGTEAATEVGRQAEITKRNVTGDLLRRGVLQSGEANTRYTEQAAATGKRLSDVTRATAEGTESADVSLQALRDQYRQQALERVLGTEQEQAIAKATQQSQAESYAQQQAASDKAQAAQDAAQKAYLDRIEQLYKTYGAQGVAV